MIYQNFWNKMFYFEVACFLLWIICEKHPSNNFQSFLIFSLTIYQSDKNNGQLKFHDKIKISSICASNTKQIGKSLKYQNYLSQ